jgi:hypothetical protein
MALSANQLRTGQAVKCRSSPTSPYPHQLVAGVVVGPLEFVFDGDHLDLVAGTLHVVADRVDVLRALPVEAQEREDADLAGHPEQLLEGGDVEIQVRLLRVKGLLVIASRMALSRVKTWQPSRSIRGLIDEGGKGGSALVGGTVYLLRHCPLEAVVAGLSG